MDNVTVVILTKNEENNIKDVISNAMKCSSAILVVDAGSEDSTVAIAKECGANVMYRPWDDDFSAQRNFALEHISTEWVLYLDADERLSDRMIEDIKKVTSSDAKPYSYKLKREAYVLGQRLKHGVMRPDYVQRLFPVKSVTWVNAVHERPETGLPVKALKGCLAHHTYDSWEQYWNKMNQYTTIWARTAYENGKKSSYSVSFGHAVFAFIKSFILDRGFLDGGLGLVMCCNYSMYTMMKYIKLISLYRVKK